MPAIFLGIRVHTDLDLYVHEINEQYSLLVHGRRNVKSTEASSLDWLVFHRDQVSEAARIIKDLEGSQTVDVLGLSAFAEEISDQLFPGTSSQHSWLRYKFFVAASLWAIQLQPGNRKPSRTLFDELERSLQKNLRKMAEESADRISGVIGARKGEDLKIWPSSIYWNGMLKIGFLQKRQGLDDVLVQLDRFRSFENLKADDNSPIEESPPELAFAIEIESFANDIFESLPNLTFRKHLKFQLSPIERAWYAKRLKERFPHSYATYLLDKPDLKSLRSAKTPFAVPIQQNDKLSHLLIASERYSRFGQGVTLLYNFVLCRFLAKTEQLSQQLETHATLFDQWRDQREGLHDWTFTDILKNLAIYEGSAERRIDPRTNRFIDAIRNCLFSDRKITQLADQTHDLFVDREASVKKGRSRTRFAEKIKKPLYIRKPNSDFTPYMMFYRWPEGKQNALNLRGVLE